MFKQSRHFYPSQNILYVRIISEVYAVPYIKEDKETIFLKTLFPSRKARKKFLNQICMYRLETITITGQSNDSLQVMQNNLVKKWQISL